MNQVVKLGQVDPLFSAESEVPRPDNRHIRFSVDPAEVDFDQLLQLFQRNAFWACDRNRESIERAVANSHPVVTVWSNDRTIGFCRATSDGVYRAVIWDVVVDDDFRKQGIGRKLVETLIAHPDLQRVERIYLFTTYQQEFYRKIGFTDNISSTMVLVDRALEFAPPEGMELPMTDDVPVEA
jgi:N-acetylglutamate synthase-like GNAT family acetyltransferase